MIRRLNLTLKARGQSTVELALLTPIVFFLVYLIIQGFKLNTRSSQEVLEQHQIKLDKLDHGNGDFVLDGLTIPPAATLDLLPEVPPINLGKTILSEGGKLLAQLGLNFALSELSIFEGDTYFSGALRGGVQTGVGSYIDSGFKTIDWEGTLWGAATGALESDAATRDFQGANPGTPSWKEALGAAAQSGAVAYTQSRGDTQAILAGSVGGLLGSDTFNKAELTKNELLLGAARGAIQSTFTGALEGKIDAKTVAIATGMGAFQTKAVASHIPLSGWSGDSRQSASFQAVNAALSTAIAGGSMKQTLFAAASGAFLSEQSTTGMAGDSYLKASLIGGAYGATMGIIEGQDIKTVGTSALQGVATGIATREIGKLQDRFVEKLHHKTPEQAQRTYEDPNYVSDVAQDQASRMDAKFQDSTRAYVATLVKLFEVQRFMRHP